MALSVAVVSKEIKKNLISSKKQGIKVKIGNENLNQNNFGPLVSKNIWRIKIILI